MNIFIRTDASINIGMGHVMRCLTLADELRQNGANVSFICREETGNLIELIEKKAYKVHRLATGIDGDTDKKLTQKVLQCQSELPDWLIIDHYDIDIPWESSLRSFTKKIMVVDDLANRQHNCDLVLNQNYGFNNKHYEKLLPQHCVRLLGPRYSLLRSQFIESRKKISTHSGEIKTILVFMGGADHTNETCKVLKAIQTLDRPDISINVVIGSLNSHRNEIEKMASQMFNTVCHFDVENVTELMIESDLSVGGGGTTTWERCCLGLPSIVIAIADNQVAIAEELSKDNYIVYAGWHENVTEKSIYEDIAFLTRHIEITRRLSSASKNLVDGKGAKRVGNYLCNNFKSIHLRLATIDDCKMVFEWRNHPEVRKHSFDSLPLSWGKHNKWFSENISSSKSVLAIGEKNNTPFGVLRYNLKRCDALISIYLDPEYSETGLGTKLLQTGNNWIREKHPDIKKIIAEVVPGNISSLKAFRKAGFRESYHSYIFKIR